MIQPASAEQAALLADLHARSFDKGWSANDVSKLMENPAVFAVVSQEHDALHGFAVAWVAAGDSELLTLAIVPEARRRGLGVELVEATAARAVARGAGSMHLEVAEDNAAARALYEKLGFAQTGRRPGYYATANGFVDAITMRLALV